MIPRPFCHFNASKLSLLLLGAGLAVSLLNFWSGAAIASPRSASRFAQEDDRSMPQLAAAPPVAPAQPELIAQADLLPVPDGDAPIGNAGDMPRMNVPTAGSWGIGGGSSEQLRSSLRYRVVVEATSERVQALVRSLVPSAFLTSSRGRSLMQVGAFSDRDNAEDAVRLLNENGLRAVIQRLP